MIFREVPGLHVFDQLRQEWLEIEKIGALNDLLLITRRKIEFLLNRHVKIVPSLHRVSVEEPSQNCLKGER